MSEAALQFLIPRLRLAYFPKEAVIVDRQAAVSAVPHHRDRHRHQSDSRLDTDTLGAKTSRRRLSTS